MFEEFLNFTGVECDAEINGIDEFYSLFNGKSFLYGMYRLFKTSDIGRWTAITEEAFPAYKNRISVFGFDWLGRIFGVKKETQTVLMFEPGTGDVLDLSCTVEDFHDVEIAEYNDDSLASEFFDEWFEKNNKYELKYNECAGYKVPLFLNGEDVAENLEVSDMEVYWELMSSLMQI